MTSADGINYVTVANETVNTDQDGNQYITDIELPDKHVCALHMIAVSLSDLYDTQEGQGEWWVYNASTDPGGPGWTERVVNSNDLIYHVNLGTARNNAGAGEILDTFHDAIEFPLPVLSGDGEFTVRQVGTSDAVGNLEWQMTFYFDIVPAADTDAYLELLLRR